MKKETWKTIIQVIVSILTAALTALGTTRWREPFFHRGYIGLHYYHRQE